MLWVRDSNTMQLELGTQVSYYTPYFSRRMIQLPNLSKFAKMQLGLSLTSLTKVVYVPHKDFPPLVRADIARTLREDSIIRFKTEAYNIIDIEENPDGLIITGKGVDGDKKLTPDLQVDANAYPLVAPFGYETAPKRYFFPESNHTIVGAAGTYTLGRSDGSWTSLTAEGVYANPTGAATDTITIGAYVES